MSDTVKSGLGIAEVIGSQREALLALCARYGASDVRVFGSVARHEAGPESDIDLLVKFQEGSSLYELSALWQDLRDLLGREVSLVSEAGLRESFRRRIEKDLVALHHVSVNEEQT
ncbi:MAG: nucleotidyltransferase family protein [Anaerolineae bacterium]|nr:nucleotidyltransferase family protein [Anaerolineae bacterium]